MNTTTLIASLLLSAGFAFGQGTTTPAHEPAKPTETKPENKPEPKQEPQAEVLAPFGKPLDFFETTALTKVATGQFFTEGPLWWNGKLLFCDLAKETISTIVPGEASPTKFRDAADQPAGSALDTQGRLLIAHFKGGKVTRTEADGTVTTILDTVGDQKLGRCNDLAVRSDGTIYTTDFNGGKDGRNIIKVAPDGKAALLPSTFKAANGLALSPDQSVLYVADYGDKLVKAFDVVADGTLSNERVFVNFKDYYTSPKIRGNPDGLKVDEIGNLYTTGPSGIWVVSPKGELLARLDVANAANVAFGGDDRKTLFITAGTTIYSVKTKHAGAAPKQPTPTTPSKK